MHRLVLAVLTCLVLLALPASAATLHVPSQYPLILDAMVFAEAGDTVLVACGTYYEGNIQMKSGVTLISETGVTGCATIDAQHMSRIIECIDCDETTAIIGFRLAGGHVMSGYGGAIFCDNSSPRLENLHILTSQVESATGGGGGGLGCLNSSPTLTNVEFNLCVLNGSTVGGGGAMAAVGASYPVLNDVTFDRNWVTDSWGGALWIAGYAGGVVRLNNVTFTENSASTVGGGGAIQISGTPTVIDGALFHDNWAAFGGAIHYDTCRPCTLRNATFTENTAAYGKGGGVLDETTPAGALTMTNLTFIDNTAATGGGGLAVNNSTMPTLSYATFARNSALTGGGLEVVGTPMTVSNATFYANTATIAGGGIYLDGLNSLDFTMDASIIAYSTEEGAIAQSSFGTQAITCTDIYGNVGGDWTGPFAPLLGIDGNISDPPLFCEQLNLILTLHEDSPCLPGANECGVLMGAHGLGCAPSTGVPGGVPVLAVHRASPNPFGMNTALSYELPSPGDVDVRVFDVSGRLVRTLIDSEARPAGLQTLVWSGRDDGGRDVASGVYFFRVDVGGESMQRRVVLLR